MVSMPSSTEGSLSMHSAVVPTSWLGSTRISSRAGSSTATAFDNATLTEKREPLPTVESTSIVQPSTRATRSTIDSPRPSPRAMRAP